MHALQFANLSLLVLFPLSWFAPILRAGILPLLGLDEISVISGIQTLWGNAPGLALLVTFLAIFAPVAKTLGVALLHADLLSPRLLPVLHAMGRLAMADVFLVALYIIAFKGIGLGSVEVAWGLWFFTACILASLLISTLTERRMTA